MSRFMSIMKFLRKEGFKIKEYFYRSPKDWYIVAVKDDVWFKIYYDSFTVGTGLYDEVVNEKPSPEVIRDAYEKAVKEAEGLREVVEEVKAKLSKLADAGFKIECEPSLSCPAGEAVYRGKKFDMFVNINSGGAISVTVYLNISDVDDAVRLLNVMEEFTESKPKK